MTMFVSSALTCSSSLFLSVRFWHHHLHRLSCFCQFQLHFWSCRLRVLTDVQPHCLFAFVTSTMQVQCVMAHTTCRCSEHKHDCFCGQQSNWLSGNSMRHLVQCFLTPFSVSWWSHALWPWQHTSRRSLPDTHLPCCWSPSATSRGRWWLPLCCFRDRSLPVAWAHRSVAAHVWGD